MAQLKRCYGPQCSVVMTIASEKWNVDFPEVDTLESSMKQLHKMRNQLHEKRRGDVVQRGDFETSTRDPGWFHKQDIFLGEKKTVQRDGEQLVSCISGSGKVS